ncbi:MAG TPA: LEPR-XLL domain-containing protein [Gemmataceae bacterium]|nr:LEPR-XLL domain-containing protein [Gemmataceae bacterium]
MKLRLFSFRRPRPATARKSGRRVAPVRSFEPRLEGLEDRVVLSATAVAPALTGAALVSSAAPSAAHAFQAQSIAPLTITNVVNQNGQLVAQGLLGSQAFTAPLTLTASPNAADPSCPILNLQLAPIHLNLLGLHVDTSAICLRITAMPGNGQLLGNLLCDVANALNNGQSLGGILGGLTSTQTNQLTSGLTSLLNSTLTDVTTPGLGLPTQQAAVAGSACNVLNLSLGPVNLNLLGLNVHLDNCNNGPVTVAVTAQPGPGNLLGNLLCNLSNLLDSQASTTALNQAFNRIAGEIQSLL